MANPLNKRFPKEFKANAGRYICMFLLLVITIIVGSGFMVLVDSVNYTLEKCNKEGLLEDGFFEVNDILNDEQAGEIQSKDIELYENFYMTDNEFMDNAKVYVFDERTDVDLAFVFEGRLPDTDSTDEVVVDRLFAANRGIKLGDTVDINGYELNVVGLVSFIDYTSLFLSNSDMVMNTFDFGVMMVSHRAFEAMDHDYITYRYSYRYADGEKTDSEKIEIAGDIQKTLVTNGAMVTNLLTAEKNQSISYIMADMGHDGPIMNVFIYVLVAIIAFIFAVLTSNTIEKESVIIGTLRALGYKKWEIIWHYLVPTVVVTLAGAVVGNGLGYTVMVKPFMDVYYSSYCIPPLEIRFNPNAFALTTIAPVVIMILINLIMLANKMSLTPLKFLRKDLKKKKQKKAVKLPDISFLSRFRIRVILQNMGSYVVLFFGIFLSSFLLMFGIGLGPLMNHFVDTIDDTVTYEYMYVLKAPIQAPEGEKLFMYGMTTRYYLNDNDIEVSVYGIDTKETEFFKDAVLSGGDVDSMTVSISDSFAKKCKVKEGDELVLKDKNNDKEYTLKVGGICPYTNNLGVYMDAKALCSLLDMEEGYYNAYVSNQKLDIPDACIGKYITRSDMLGAAKQMMVSFDTIILFVNIFSVFAYIVFMYLLTKLVIDKNGLFISFMKVFGYEKKEIRRLYLDPSAIVVIASLIICIPLEVMAFKVAIVYFSSLIEGYMPFYLPGYIYAEIIGIGIAAYFLINLIHMRNIRKIPMSEALKNRE